MDDFLGVDVLTGLDQLVDVVPRLDLVESLAPAHKVREGLVVADVEHDVDVLLVFEVAVKAHDILVGQRSVDLDLARKLLASLGPGEVALGHDLQSPSLGLIVFSLDGLKAADLVALGESSFAQEALSEVLDNLPWLSWVIRVRMLALLLDDLTRLGVMGLTSGQLQLSVLLPVGFSSALTCTCLGDW